MFSFLKRSPPATPPIVRLTAHDGMTLHQAMEGVLVIGATGSGKTSGPGYALAKGLLRAGAGFCVLCPKPGDYAMWKHLCEQEGRAGDLVRFGPGSPLKCDVLDYEMGLPEGTVEATAQLLDILLEVASRKGSGQGDEQFWMLFGQKIMRWLITLVWLGKQRCSITDLYRVITSAPSSPEEVASAEWRKDSYCAECLIEAAAKSAVLPQQDLGLCVTFWTQEWPKLSEKTRSIGYTMTTNVLEKFLTGPIAEMASSGTTNFTPEHIAAGKVCVLDMPYLKWRDPGRFFQILFKTLVQRATLRRDVKPDSRPVVVWQDEGQVFITDQDVMVQTVAWQSRLVNVFLTQSLPVLYEALGGGQRAEQQAQSLCGNLQTKFICQQSDKLTNEYMSELLGHSKHLFMNGHSPGADFCLVSEMLGTESPHQQQGSAGFSEQWHPDVPPGEFTKLAKGGEQWGKLVEAYCFQGGRVFSNGKTHLRCVFAQE